jgi:hypothetical protein
VVFGIVGVIAGCARPDPGVYQGAWDGQATEWEVPPARIVTGADGGTGSGGGGLGLGGGLPVCTKSGQTSCCYDDKPGHPVGTPKCGWQRLAPGESVVITAAFKKDQKVTLPVPVTLTSVSPAAFATYDECLKAPIGFVLSGPGIEEGSLGGDISHYHLEASGAWVGEGGGGQSGLVAGRDTQAGARDGGAPNPTYTLHEGLCQPLMASNVTASISLFDQVDFQIDGVDYRADFRSFANGGGASAFYVIIAKGF